MKKIIIGVLLTLCIILVAGILFIGALEYSIVYKISDIDKAISEDNLYKVEFQTIGQAVGFGPQHARLVLFNDKNKVSVNEFWIYNDGKVISERDWKTNWFDDRVEVLVFGEEQSDILYIMFFDGTTEIEYPNTHYGENISEIKKEALISEEQNENTEQIESEDYSFIYKVEEGYYALYSYFHEPDAIDFEVSYGASVNSSSCILYENDETVVYLAYDRESKNGKCGLYVKYSASKNEDGSWYKEDSIIEDIYAYVYTSGDIVSSGKKSWQDFSSEDYQYATGEY